MSQTSPLLVVQISDTHLFGNDNQELLGLPTAYSLKAVLERINQLRPDLLLLTGDLSQDETLESYQKLRELLASLNLPAYWLPGNHDRTSIMEQVLCDFPISTEKCFQQGGWNFVLLNSAVPGQVYGQLSLETLSWLEQQLMSDRPTLIGLHHPPLPIHSDWMDKIGLQNPEALLEIVDRHPQVKLVTFGHIHQAFDNSRHGVRYLGTPSTCVQFKPNSALFAVDEEQPGFRVLQLYPDGSYHTQVERVSFSCQLDVAAQGY